MPAGLEPVDDGVAVTGSVNGAAAPDDAATEETVRQQLAQRTAEVAGMRAEIAALSAQLSGSVLTPQVAEWKAKAAEYDALMATKTMHAVRIPRAIYGRILARRAR
jgi:hypothetical protein